MLGPALWIGVGALLATGWTHAPWSAPAAAVEEVLVTRVIDGDTIELQGGERVRYVGVDTPELYRRSGAGWIYQPEPLAEEAAAFNRLAVEGRPVRLEFDREPRDRFHRRLAYVYQADRFINAELVRLGLANTLTIAPNTRHADLFRRLEREARSGHRGLWARTRAEP